VAWGNRHFAPEGASVVLVDTQTGIQADPMLVDRNTGAELASPRFRTIPGPAADASTREKFAPVMEALR
jgi:hypothetical protein